MKKVIFAAALCVLLAAGCGDKKEEAKASYTELGMECIESGTYEEALANFEAADAAKEDAQLVSRGKGIAYIGLGNYETAIENLKLVLKKAPGKVTELELDTAYYLALAQYKNSDREGAVKTYGNILSFNDKDERAYYLRGIVYLADGNMEQAIKDFDAAVASAPDQYELYISIFQNLHDKGYEAEGKNYLKKALEIKDSKDTGLNKGMIYYYMGDTTNALAELTKAKDAGEKKAVLYLGRVYELMNDTNSAVSLYEEYLAGEENPEGAGSVYNTIGLCRMEEQDYKAAIANFSAGIALQESGTLQELMFNEIAAYEYSGDFKTAAEKMKAYVEQYPDDSSAKREYDFLKTR